MDIDTKFKFIKIASTASVLPELIANRDLVKSDQNPLNVAIEAGQVRNLSKTAVAALFAAAWNYQSMDHCEHCTI